MKYLVRDIAFIAKIVSVVIMLESVFGVDVTLWKVVFMFCGGILFTISAVVYEIAVVRIASERLENEQKKRFERFEKIVEGANDED